MNWKFKNAVLPCNELKDFETTDVSLDIICRIYLSEAPSEEHEKIARELDGVCYTPDCFFIESVAGKNESDGEICTSDWMLFYALDDGSFHEFGFVSEMEEGHDVEGAWEFFQTEIFKGQQELDEKIQKASERTSKGSEGVMKRQTDKERS